MLIINPVDIISRTASAYAAAGFIESRSYNTITKIVAPKPAVKRNANKLAKTMLVVVALGGNAVGRDFTMIVI